VDCQASGLSRLKVGWDTVVQRIAVRRHDDVGCLLLAAERKRWPCHEIKLSDLKAQASKDEDRRATLLRPLRLFHS